MSSNQNITSRHRSRNRERDGCVLPMTSLQKEKLASFFRLLSRGFISCLLLFFFTGAIGCVKRFPRLETEPNPEDLVGTWINDKSSSINEVSGEFSIILLSDATARVANFPFVTLPKMEHDIRFINGKGKWLIDKQTNKYNKFWCILLNKPDSNEWVRLYLEHDSNDILLAYYINPNWPAGIVFRKTKKEPSFSSCSAEQTNNMNNQTN